MAAKMVKLKKYKHKLSPWMTKDILKAIKLRDDTFHQLDFHQKQSPKWYLLHEKLKEHKFLVKKAIRQAKSQYHQDQFEKKNRSNIRRVWWTIKYILSKHKRKSDFPHHYIVNNRKISDAKQIADHFNIFFASVGTNLSKNIAQPEGLKISKYLTQRIAYSFNFDCISVSAVNKIMQDLASKNSCGVDNISTNFLKKISHVIASGLTQIVNQSLCTGIFPTKMKTAKIAPLYKKGEAYSLDNYRPISLLSSLSKVF